MKSIAPSRLIRVARNERDLTIKKLIKERRKKRRRGEAFSLRHLKYRLLALGLDLHLKVAPPDPLIDDDRIGEA